MKKILVLSLLLLSPHCVLAGSSESGSITITGVSIFPTECPDGYVAVDAPSITIATSCPSGTVSVGTADSCWFTDSLSGVCVMYAPADRSYYDAIGTYEFTDPCPME